MDAGRQGARQAPPHSDTVLQAQAKQQYKRQRMVLVQTAHLLRPCSSIAGPKNGAQSAREVVRVPSSCRGLVDRSFLPAPDVQALPGQLGLYHRLQIAGVHAPDLQLRLHSRQVILGDMTCQGMDM